jgi:uncharacterized membrane protein YciS (DUF1049 family)
MGYSEDPGRQDLQRNIKSIVEISEKWLGRLRRRELWVRRASAFLTAILVSLAVGGGLAGFLFLEGRFNTILTEPRLVFFVAGTVLLAGIVSGIARYFWLKRKQNAGLMELTNLVSEIKKIELQANAPGFTENALSLADKITSLLPEMVRKRSQDPLLFGAVALIIATVFGNNLGVGILVGAIVWIYFRYETRKTYEQEISKLEEQRKLFEKRKNEFLETL